MKKKTNQEMTKNVYNMAFFMLCQGEKLTIKGTNKKVEVG